MAVVSIYRISIVKPPSPRWPDSRPPAPGFVDKPKGRHPKMRIVPEGGEPFIVPYAPRGGSTTSLVPEWAQVTRGGREPLLLRAGKSLPTMSFDLVFGYSDPQQSIERELARLRRLATSGKRMRIKLDATSAAYRWRLTGFTQEVIMRQFGTNEPTRALCQLTFTAASDAIIQVGPLSGGSKGGGRLQSEIVKGGGGGKDKRPKTWTVKKGDTLQSIAKEVYGEAKYWREIADANKIRDPKKIKPGDRLTLPRILRSELVA